MTLALGPFMEVSVSGLKAAVETQHKVTAKFVTKIKVPGFFFVYIFDLQGHPSSTRAYAWSTPLQDGAERRFYAILHENSVASPSDAVKSVMTRR